MLKGERARKILIGTILISLGVVLAGLFLSAKVRLDKTPLEPELPPAVAVSEDGELSGDGSNGTASWSYLASEQTATFDEMERYYDEFFVFDSEKMEEPAPEMSVSPDELPPALPERVLVTGTPALAIVVDDCGFNMEYARRLRDCKLSLTWAIIPNLRYSRETADMLVAEEIPFLIHVPMQAYVDPDGKAGNANLYSVGVGMSESAVQSAVAPLLDSLPEAYGINNHRGSKATSDPSLMRHVMKVLRERDLFFMDSSTSSKTVAYRTAREYGLDAVKNNYFLDNESDREKVRAQLDRAIAGAKKRGSAVAICHLRTETIAFFELTDASYFTSRGVRLVTLPELVELRKETGGHE